MQIALIIALSFVGLYGLFVLFLFLRQRSLQYRPTHRDPQGKGDHTFRPWRDASGTFLGYYRPAPRPRKAVLFFHGNGGEALDRAWMAEVVSKETLLVLAEYPGFGARRTGRISEHRLLQDAEKMVAEIRRQWGNLPLMAVGESLGSASACYLASIGLVERLALIAPFSSAESIAARLYPYLPVKFLMRDKFRSIDYIKSAKVPVHVLHGTLDDLVPIEEAKNLFQAYPATEKYFSEIPGFGHSALGDAVAHSPFAEGFRTFIRAT